MKSIILLLIPLLFLSSCTIDWNDEKDIKIAELEKQIQDDTFNKKQECTKYTSEIEKRINADISNQLHWFKIIKEIFYSKNKNTCFVIIEEKESDTLNEYYVIEDLLSKEKTRYNKNTEILLYGNKIQELKWNN